MSSVSASPDFRVRVLLIDDQPLIGEAVRRLLAGEQDLEYHYLKDPQRAVETALAIRPTVILQDLVMPEIDGFSLVETFRADPRLKDVPMIVLSTKEEAVTKERAFRVGANDYLVKLPDRLELLARIRYHSQGYINLLQRNEAYRQLEESQKLLASEVASAAEYVQSLFPARISEGSVQSDWRFIPSTALSGDTFGYHWLDDRHFACYLLDVVGHGVAAALLSVSVLNAIRSRSLPDVDFFQPGQVMSGLNRRFQMAQQSDKYFTAWYGIYDRQERQLRYSGGGHPPAMLFTGPNRETCNLTFLESSGPGIGIFEDWDFETDTAKVESFGNLFLYSDGVFEVHLPDGRTWTNEELGEFSLRMVREQQSMMDRLMEHTLAISQQDHWEDDFSIVELRLL